VGVEWASESVDYPAQQFLPDRSVRAARQRRDAGTRRKPGDLLRRHQENPIVRESHDFRFDRLAFVIVDDAATADCRRTPGCFERESRCLYEAAFEQRRLLERVLLPIRQQLRPTLTALACHRDTPWVK
jgi:hypothetical protein